MKNNSDKVIQRTRQYWFSDGIVELSVGSLFLILAVYFYLQYVLPAGSWLLVGLQIGFVFLLFGGIYLSRSLVDRLKSRLTFQRTGYVSYKRASRRQRLVSTGIVCLVAGINIAIFLATPVSVHWIPAATGLIVGSLWLISALRVGLLRFYLQAILAYLLGISLSISSIEIYYGLAIFYGILGSILLISGAWVLAAYLRHNPALEEDGRADSMRNGSHAV
jgi:hypothetical protein